MYKAKERLGCMDDPFVIEISQFLDLKLNVQVELIKSHSKNGGMDMAKKKAVNKTVLKVIKSEMKEQEQEQLKWQKLVIREEHL